MIDYKDEKIRGEPKETLFYGRRDFSCVREFVFLYLRSLLVGWPTPMNDDDDRPKEGRLISLSVDHYRHARAAATTTTGKRVEKDDLLRRPIWSAAEDFLMATGANKPKITRKIIKAD